MYPNVLGGSANDPKMNITFTRILWQRYTKKSCFLEYHFLVDIFWNHQFSGSQKIQQGSEILSISILESTKDELSSNTYPQTTLLLHLSKMVSSLRVIQKKNYRDLGSGELN
jgi:hypothetical protein